MKPFNASEFISNQDTPVVSRHKKPVEIVTTKGRGAMKVVGYASSDTTLSAWSDDGFYTATTTSDWDLFFAPKVEVVHIFKPECGMTVALINKKDVESWKKVPMCTYLGTITGPIVPPEKESGVEK